MTRALGLDPGTKRIGVAVSDSSRTLAFPRTSIEASESAVQVVVNLVREESIATVVVGRPLTLAGKVSASTTKAEEFSRDLERALPDVELIRWDERLTTVSAQKSMTSAGKSSREQRDSIDSAAAVVLLQHFLESDHA
jgi:putative Holliday junction resolvase